MANATARPIDDLLRSLHGDEPGAQEQLRHIARQYKNKNLFFVDTERPRISIDLLTEKAEEVGLTGDVEIRSAIECLENIPRMGWDD